MKKEIFSLSAFPVLLLLGSCSVGAPPEGSLPAAPAAPAATIPLVEGKSSRLTKANGAPLYVLERIGEVWSPLIKQPVPVPAGPVTFWGWAVDETQKNSAAGVDILIDGKPFGADYGIERGDVANFFKVPAYKDSGFKLTVPARGLDKGRHQVAVRVLAKDGKSYYEGGPVVFEVQ